MRALASVDSGVVKAEIEIEATPARVFRALTGPTELAAFWGSDDMYRTSDWKIASRTLAWRIATWLRRARAKAGNECSNGSPSTSRPRPSAPSPARKSVTSEPSRPCLR